MLHWLSLRMPQIRGRLAGCSIAAVFGMFVGAHALFFIVGLPGFSEKYAGAIYDVQSFLTAVLNASSGMVFYGGLFGAILGILLYCRASCLYARSYLNAGACVFPLVHAFGRIGCAIGGCCYGIEYHGIGSIQYTATHIKPGISDHIADFARFPVQPLEAVLEFVLCFLLIRLYLRTSDRYPLTAVYLFAYGIIRFLDEFLRGDTVRGIWGPFSTSQWIALASIIGTVLYYFLRKRASAQNA